MLNLSECLSPLACQRTGVHSKIAPQSPYKDLNEIMYVKLLLHCIPLKILTLNAINEYQNDSTYINFKNVAEKDPYSIKVLISYIYIYLIMLT